MLSHTLSRVQTVSKATFLHVFLPHQLVRFITYIAVMSHSRSIQHESCLMLHVYLQRNIKEASGVVKSFDYFQSRLQVRVRDHAGPLQANAAVFGSPLGEFIEL